MAALALCSQVDAEGDESQDALNMQFFNAVHSRNQPAMEAALEAGADIDAVVEVSAEVSMPAIMHAALQGDTGTVQYLLNEGADADIPDSCACRKRV